MAVLSAVRDMDRLRQITQVLIRHGFGELARRMGLPTKTKEGDKVPRPEIPKRLRLVLEDLGPTFVKIGQMASSRTDVLPEDLCTELAKLQDEVRPFGSDQARAQIEETLGAPVEEIFETFADEPLASASIGQVHRATLKLEETGEVVDVAVKIQRPGIADTVARDLNLLHMLARLIERTVPEARIYSPTGLAREFDAAISAELDFTTEALNADRFALNFEGDPDIRFPKVYPQASGKRVLTLEFFDGLKVTDAVAQGASGEYIANTAVRLLLKMIFEDGFFHADPHPGNILILPRPGPEGYGPDDKLIFGLLDLGLVGRLSPELRDKTVDLLLAAARQDTDAMADAMLSIGKTNRRVDHAAFRAEVKRLAERHLGKPIKEIEAAAMVQDIVSGAMKFDIEVPTELAMLGRAIMTIEGVGKQVHPDLDFIQIAAPHLTRIVWQRYHPMRIGKDLMTRAGTLNALMKNLPLQLSEIIDDLRRGKLEIQARDPASADATERLGLRLRATVLSSALLGSGVALLAVGKQTNLAWTLLAVAGLWMLGHLFFDRRSRKKQDRR